MAKCTKMVKSVSSEAGITIIALVVTIVVLLILAGISITGVLGKNGVIESTIDAVNKIVTSENEIQNNLNSLMEETDRLLNTETEEPTPPTNFQVD